MHPNLLDIGEIYGIYQISGKKYRFTLNKVRTIETRTIRDNSGVSWLPNEYEMEVSVRAEGLDVQEMPEKDPSISESEWEDMILKGVGDKHE